MRGPAQQQLRTKEERDELVVQYLPLVKYVVARLPVTMPATLDRDDFYSVGVMGLMHAASAFDPGRGASFKTFAYTAIRGAILAPTSSIIASISPASCRRTSSLMPSRRAPKTSSTPTAERGSTWCSR